MLRKRIALTIGILLIVCIFLVIAPHSASAQKLAMSTKTIFIGVDDATSRASEFFAKRGMTSESFPGERADKNSQWKVNLIFGVKQNMTCGISLYPLGYMKTVTVVAVASNNRNEAKKMRDSIISHLNVYKEPPPRPIR